MSTSTLGMEVCVETRLYHHVENRDGAAVSDQEDITIPTQVDAPRARDQPHAISCPCMTAGIPGFDVAYIGA